MAYQTMRETVETEEHGFTVIEALVNTKTETIENAIYLSNPYPHSSALKLLKRKGSNEYMIETAKTMQTMKQSNE